jgi:hypothetical protein
MNAFEQCWDRPYSRQQARIVALSPSLGESNDRGCRCARNRLLSIAWRRRHDVLLPCLQPLTDLQPLPAYFALWHVAAALILQKQQHVDFSCSPTNGLLSGTGLAGQSMACVGFLNPVLLT